MFYSKPYSQQSLVLYDKDEVPLHTTKAYGGADVQLHALILVLDVGE